MHDLCGFSLIEVLISVFIMTSVLLGLAETLAIELKHTQRIYQQTLHQLQVNETSNSGV